MNENIVQIKSGPDATAVYRCSNRRWFLLLTVAMLNIANYAHWISFAAVHSKGNLWNRSFDYDSKHLITDFLGYL